MDKWVSSREYAQFLRALCKARKRAGVTQAEVATRIGQTQSFVSKCERGERRIDIVELRHFCRALGISLVDFVKRLNETAK
jgi:transcriptional regulator with XRE-family HTH domain